MRGADAIVEQMSLGTDLAAASAAPGKLAGGAPQPASAGMGMPATTLGAPLAVATGGVVTPPGPWTSDVRAYFSARNSAGLSFGGLCVTALIYKHVFLQSSLSSSWMII